MLELQKTKVDITHCAKTYADGTRALLSTDLSIAAGEIVALLGPSGCGKTTLLRMIAGLETPDTGSTISFNGEDVSRIAVEDRNIGMVFQHYALFPTMNVQANIAYGLRVRGVPLAQRNARVAELINLVQLSGMEHKRVQELSGGQRQRVALARAIATQPRLLLLDEPLTALDAKLKESLRDELALMLRTLGMTAIYVTHDQQEAFAVADRLVVMQKGQIVQTGTPKMLYEKPTHAFVAEFLGHVNLLPTQAGNQPTATYIRPEHLQVCSSTNARLSGMVQRTSYLGDKQRLWVAVPGQLLKVDVANDLLIADGQTVGLRWSDAHVFSVQE
jgi:putative spermidine/putrescine transport system ATP-binding protein